MLNRITIAAFVTVSLTTAAFAKSDSEFLKDAIKGDNSEVALGTLASEDHKKDIAEFKEEADKNSGEVSAYASKILPDLEKHLKLAESIAQ